jgi:hypothetical protein
VKRIANKIIDVLEQPLDGEAWTYLRRETCCKMMGRHLWTYLFVHAAGTLYLFKTGITCIY